MSTHDDTRIDLARLRRREATEIIVGGLGSMPVFNREVASLLALAEASVAYVDSKGAQETTNLIKAREAFQ